VEPSTRLERCHQLLDVLHLEQPALVLVMSPPGIGPAALRRLAVAEVERDLAPFGRTVSSASQSEHDEPPCYGVPLRLNERLSLRDIG
jgi:hypothetical protein